MSTAVINTGPAAEVRPEIRGVLGRLRGKLRRYIFLEGSLLALVVVAALFWVSLGIDWVYFLVRRLELPVWFRQTFLFATIALFITTLVLWVVVRMAKRMREKSLALVLERRFPDLNDRLITAVELRESTTGRETELTREMLSRTVREVTEETNRLRVRDVLNNWPLGRAALFAGILAGSIAVFAAFNSVAVQRWIAAYVNWDDAYWDREIEMKAYIISSATGQRKEFNSDLVYKHPRGADLKIEVSVSPGGFYQKMLAEHFPNAIKPKLPDEVELRYETDDGRTDEEAKMLLRNGVFYKKIDKLRDSIEFHVVGGDFTNVKPYRIEVVDPPQVKTLTLNADHAEYTGHNFEPEKVSRVLGKSGTANFPIGTRFTAEGKANKNLLGLRVETDHYILRLTRDGGSITGKAVKSQALGGEIVNLLPNPRRLTKAEARSMWGADDTFALPFVVLPGEQAIAETSKLKYAEDELVADIIGTSILGGAVSSPLGAMYAADELVRREQSNETMPIRLPLPEKSSEQLRIHLHDKDDIWALRPYRVEFTGTPDVAPTMIVEKAGVRNKITKSAIIPFTGEISDDFGVEQARFEYRVIMEGEKLDDPVIRNRPWKKREFAIHPRAYAGVPTEIIPLFTTARHYGVDQWLAPGPKSFRLGPKPPADPYAPPSAEIFAAPSIKLMVDGREEQVKEGQVIQIRIYSEDGNSLYGPGVTTSNVESFQIVPASQVMLAILTDEISQVRQFKEIVKKMERVEEELKVGKNSVIRADPLRNKKDSASDDELKLLGKYDRDVGNVIENSVHNLTTSRADSNGVENAFRRLLWEMENNKLNEGIYQKTYESKRDVLLALFRDLNGDRKQRLENNEPTGLFEKADLSLSALKLAQRKAELSGADPASQYDDAVTAVQKLNAKLRDTLEKLEDIVHFQELIRQALLILDAQKGLLKDTIKKSQDIFGLGNP